MAEEVANTNGARTFLSANEAGWKTRPPFAPRILISAMRRCVDFVDKVCDKVRDKVLLRNSPLTTHNSQLATHNFSNNKLGIADCASLAHGDEGFEEFFDAVCGGFDELAADDFRRGRVCLGAEHVA